MSNKKFIGGLAVGILASSLVSYFLNTRQGKKLVEDVADFTSSAIEEIKFGIDNIDITLERIFHKRKTSLDELDPEKDFTEYDEIFS